MIKYRYAFDGQGNVVNVDNLSRNRISGEVRRTEESHQDKAFSKFKCISCENELIPRLGEIRRKYFAHKSGQTCSEETYLHKLCKAIFAENYRNCIENNEPFFIEYKEEVICNRYEMCFGA